MIEALNTVILYVTDLLLGWLLSLPKDIVLFVVAVGSAAILTLVRPFTTNQDLLARCGHDKRRLKELMREAKARKDKESAKRYGATRNMVSLKTLKAEGYPLLVAIIPIALLATWCFQRLEFHPPQLDEPIEITATFAASAVGELVHIVPEKGLTAESGWIQQVGEGIGDGAPRGSATWIVRATGAPRDYALKLRYNAKTYETQLRVGRSTYSDPVTFHDDRLLSVEVAMEPVRLFNVVPGIPALLFAPWLVAYLLITIPFVFILKRLLTIY